MQRRDPLRAGDAAGLPHRRVQSRQIPVLAPDLGRAVLQDPGTEVLFLPVVNRQRSTLAEVPPVK